MKPWSVEFAGRIEEHTFESEALRGNPLGDPSERPLWVYLPPGYDHDAGRRYPCVYVIQGLTGQLDMWRNRAAFRPNYPELIDDLFSNPETPPAVVVLVDAWTSLGGSQYLNSPGTGRYLDYLCDEVVPFVDATYRTEPARDRRGIQGKSSGGYGAMVVPMLRPDVFSALASHAGDALFEVCYQPGFAESVRALRKDYGGSFDRFWEDFRSRPAFSKESDGQLLNDWCMAACYSADETRGRGTNGTWTWAPWPCRRSSRPSASTTSSSCSTRPTCRSSTGTRRAWRSWPRRCRAESRSGGTAYPEGVAVTLPTAGISPDSTTRPLRSVTSIRENWRRSVAYSCHRGCPWPPRPSLATFPTWSSAPNRSSISVTR